MQLRSDSESDETTLNLTRRGEELRGEVERLSPVQRFAAWFAVCTGVTIGLIILFVLWRRLVPDVVLPPLPPGIEAGSPKIDAYLKQYRELNAIEDARAKSLFELAVTTSLLPILTTLLGFLIGRAGRDGE